LGRISLGHKNIVLLSVVLILFTSIVALNTHQSFAAVISLQAIGIGNHDSWAVDPLGTPKTDAINTAGDGLMILRESNAKLQTFQYELNGVPAGAPITSVEVHAIAKKDSNKNTKLELVVEKGGTANDIFSGPQQSVGNTFAEIPFYELTENPFTGQPWTDQEVNTWQLSDGTDIYFGAKNQQQQNRPLTVDRLWLVVNSLDATAPEITPTVTGTLGNNGWYTSDVTVSWVVVEDESPSSLVTTDCGDTTINSDTAFTQVTCTAESDGGISSITVDIMRDETAPTQAPIPTEVFDDEGNDCTGLTCQADDVTGSVIFYSDPTPSDATSGVFTSGCLPASDTLFPIQTTTVTCTVEDFAGNQVSDSFDVTVLPFVAFAFELPSYEIGTSIGLIVSDPAANLDDLLLDEVVATVFSPSSTRSDPSNLNRTLTETAPDSNIFTTNDIIFSSIATVDSEGLLLVAIGEIVIGQYPADAPVSFSSTLVDPPSAAGVTAGLSDLDSVRWSADVVTIESSANAAILRNAAACALLDDTVIDTVPVQIFTINEPQPDPDLISFNFIENAVDSCIFEPANFVKFTQLTDSIDDPNAAGFPQLRTVEKKTIKLLDVDTGKSRNTLVWSAPTFIPTTGISLPTTAENCGANNDNDNDGVCDDWENSGTGLIIPFGGATYHYPCSPLVDDPVFGHLAPLNDPVRNPVVCPSPGVKDIFIEVDFMLGHRPLREALVQVSETFQNAPEPINLHIQVDENYGFHTTTLPFDPCVVGDPGCPFGSYRQLKLQFFGTSQDRTDDVDGLAVDKLVAKRQVFRNAAYIHNQASNPTSSGYAEICGNELLVSLGLFAAGMGSVDQQAGTLLHEVGHLICLNHGGPPPNAQGCKANYLSVMNYAFQMKNRVPDRPLDLSREKLPDLDERHLDESIGIVSAETTGRSTIFGNANKGPLELVPLIVGNNPIDWNQNNVDNQLDVVGNINQFGFPACKNEAEFGGAIDVLTGFDDWDGIDLLMRNSVFFADGVKALNVLDPTNLADDFSGVELPEDVSGTGVDLPTADSGGPYSCDEGIVRILDSSGSTDVPPGFVVDTIEGIDTRLWDIDNDGIFDEPPNAALDEVGDARGIMIDLFCEDDENLNGDGTGDFDVTLAVWDNEDNLDTDVATITISNVAPIVTAAGSLEIGPGEAVEFTAASPAASFIDPGIQDTHTAMIDWGEGAGFEAASVVITNTGAEPTDTTALQPIEGDITTGSHTYEQSGVFPVTITVADEDGGSHSDTLTVTVSNESVFLVIDVSSIDNGNPPNFFSEVDVNDDIADIGQRSQLSFFAANVGNTITLYTGEVGDEGWFALKDIPGEWDAAGPTADGLRNFVGPAVGPGLGTGADPEALLDEIRNVTPLRAFGLNLLEGQNVCAVAYDSHISINYHPLQGSLKGANLGIVAFEVISVTQLTGESDASLPQVEIKILDADNVCQGDFVLLDAAPKPQSSSKPFDVVPP